MTFVISYAVVLIIGIVIGTYLYYKYADTAYEPEPKLCCEKILEGEPVSIKEDKSGLSRVTVKKSDGSIIYGFSPLPTAELQTACDRKDWIKIQLTDAPNGRAYQMEVDYWEGDTE